MEKQNNDRAFYSKETGECSYSHSIHQGEVVASTTLTDPKIGETQQNLDAPKGLRGAKKSLQDRYRQNKK